MSLEQKFRKKFILHRTPSEDVSNEIKQGKKFIVVDENFNSPVPLGYMLIDMKYRDGSFKTLVPQNLLFFLANPGEGSIDDALDEIGDFYGNVEEFEDGLLEENGESVQGTNWAVTARNAYTTYLINKLINSDEKGPEWNEETLKSLNLEDDYVGRRVKAIAAVALGKTAEQVRNYNLGDILKHVTINQRKIEQLTSQEFDKITCWTGSHYEIKGEYKHKDDVEYEIDYRHDTNHKSGKKITNKQDVHVLDAKINELEDEIEKYKENGRHDKMLRRMYVNLRYIAKEDPQKQLEIKPS